MARRRPLADIVRLQLPPRRWTDVPDDEVGFLVELTRIRYDHTFTVYDVAEWSGWSMRDAESFLRDFVALGAIAAIDEVRPPKFVRYTARQRGPDPEPRGY